MLFIIFILSLFVFLKTIGYALYEYTQNSNIKASIIIVILAFISLIGPCAVMII